LRQWLSQSDLTISSRTSVDFSPNERNHELPFFWSTLCYDSMAINRKVGCEESRWLIVLRDTDCCLCRLPNSTEWWKLPVNPYVRIQTHHPVFHFSTSPEFAHFISDHIRFTAHNIASIDPNYLMTLKWLAIKPRLPDCHIKRSSGHVT
jgi:hypothetical protein